MKKLRQKKRELPKVTQLVNARAGMWAKSDSKAHAPHY